MKKILLLLISISVFLCSCTGSTADESSVDQSTASSAETSEETVVATTGGLKFFAPETAGDIDMPDEIDAKYLNPIIDRLDNAPYACALYYCDLETGLALSYNGDRMFAGASLVKAEFLLPIFEKIQSGELSYETLLEYNSSVKRGGTTQIPKDFKYGDMLPLKTVIEYTVWYSDNTGFRMLQNLNSLSSFMSWAKHKYGAKFEYEGCNWLNANGVAACWKDIYSKYSAGDPDFQWYVSLLLNANENKFVKGGLPKGDNGDSLYPVAHKYGMDINASNDAAIVFYKDRPYLLIILTDYIGYNTQSFMNKLSADVLEMHEYICGFDS